MRGRIPKEGSLAVVLADPNVEIMSVVKAWIGVDLYYGDLGVLVLVDGVRIQLNSQAR